jgi:triosephosphate isomerase
MRIEMRKPMIAGNWKMHKDNQEAEYLVKDLAGRVMDLEDVEIVVCPPFTALADVSRFLDEAGSDIKLGAQNVYPEPQGAFTGEISPLMLKAIDVDYVIVGHSERREIMGEGDDLIARKLRTVLDAGMNPILCVGETLEERERGEARDKVEGQLKADLAPLNEGEISEMVIAYEPIWAIGTGKTATPQDAQDMTAFIRAKMVADYGESVTADIRILYGGSVKPGNIADLMAMEDIDGALVGGASLKAEDFAAIASFQA